MIYELIFSRQAKEDLSKLKKSEPKAFKKASKHRLVYEIHEEKIDVLGFYIELNDSLK